MNWPQLVVVFTAYSSVQFTCLVVRLLLEDEKPYSLACHAFVNNDMITLNSATIVLVCVKEDSYIRLEFESIMEDDGQSAN